MALVAVAQTPNPAMQPTAAVMLVSLEFKALSAAAAAELWRSAASSRKEAMMEEAIRQEGYLVFQETAGPGGWSVFRGGEEQAEAVAARMLSHNISVIVIPAVQFTTRRMQEQR